MCIETFNKIFDVKTKKIICLECGKTKEIKYSAINIYDNYWWICEECEKEINLKLQCFDNDVESGINYNLTNY